MTPQTPYLLNCSWALMLQLMKLEMLLKTIDDWYEWAAMLDHKHHKITQAIEQTRGTLGKEKTPPKNITSPERNVT
jgi:hypothetical protein